MLGSLLSDPKTGEKLRALLGNDGKSAPAPPPDEKKDDALSALSGMLGGGDMPDPQTVKKLTRAMNAINSKHADSRTRLLYDLKPYISPARAQRIDEAAQMLRLLGALDILRGEGEDRI